MGRLALLGAEPLVDRAASVGQAVAAMMWLFGFAVGVVTGGGAAMVAR